MTSPVSRNNEVNFTFQYFSTGKHPLVTAYARGTVFPSSPIQITVTEVAVVRCSFFPQSQEKHVGQQIRNYVFKYFPIHDPNSHSNIRRYITFVVDEVHLNNPVTNQQAMASLLRDNTRLLTCLLQPVVSPL